MERTRQDTMERVGRFEMQVRCGEDTAALQERWRRRSDLLAAWLLEQWQRRQRELAERN